MLYISHVIVLISELYIVDYTWLHALVMALLKYGTSLRTNVCSPYQNTYNLVKSLCNVACCTLLLYSMGLFMVLYC